MKKYSVEIMDSFNNLVNYFETNHIARVYNDVRHYLKNKGYARVYDTINDIEYRIDSNNIEEMVEA